MMTVTRPLPVLMRRDEIINLKKACAYASRHADTIRRWCHVYGIGRQAGPNAPLEISILALEMVLNGDFPALEDLRAGRRATPAVARYLDFLGVPT